MSIVNSASADGFIEQLPRGFRFYLVHGSDEGLTDERCKAIVHKVLGENPDPLRLVRLEGELVAREPGALADEAYAVPMFGGSRAIWIDAQGRDLLPALDPLFARPPCDCTIVVKAAQIQKGNALRAAFEETSNGASVECFSDRSKVLAPLIENQAQEAGIAIAPDARAALLGLQGADRRSTRGEVQKLILYARGRRRIEARDIEAIVSCAAPAALDDLIDQSLLGDLRLAAASAARFFNEAGDGDLLATRLMARLTLLHRVRVEMDEGRPFDAAWEALLVKLPTAARRAVAQQAEWWTSDAIAQRLPAVRAASAKVRAETGLKGVLAARILWALASRSRSGKS